MLSSSPRSTCPRLKRGKKALLNQIHDGKKKTIKKRNKRRGARDEGRGTVAHGFRLSESDGINKLLHDDANDIMS